MLEMVWLAGIGQALFVLMWMWQPWWRTWVGQALFIKSAALLLYIGIGLSAIHLPPYPYQAELRMAAMGAVVVGIWYQPVALAREMWLAWRDRRDVGGTEHEPSDPPTRERL